MPQIIRTETLDVIRQDIETAIRARAEAEAVEDGLLYPTDIEQIYIQRKINVNLIAPPCLFVLRGPWTNSAIGGHTIMGMAEYHFCPFEMNHDPAEGEDIITRKALNCFDMFISQGDRSLSGDVYDVKWLDTSDVFELQDRDKVYFAITRLRFEFLKRTT